MNEEFFSQLQTIVGKEQCLSEESMAAHTTFRVGGPAEYYVRPTTGQIQPVLALCRKYGIPWHVIGNGSNLLVSDQGVRGLVLEIGKMASAISTEGNCLYAQAGALLSQAATFAAAHSLSGMEFAAGIPGSIGGAVTMNAGAYGGEIKQILKSVTVLTDTGEEQNIPVESLDLSYRHSCIPSSHFIVLRAEFQLAPGAQQSIEAQMAALK